MYKITTNITKGIVGRLKSSKSSNKYDLSWLQRKVLKHQDDTSIKEYKFANFRIFYRRPYELLHTYQELFEKELYRFKANTDTPRIIDCGANIGLSIIYFKILYKQAYIEAFEPDERNFELLSKNCNSNQLQLVTLHQAAVWTYNGTISFAANESEASHISENVVSSNVEVRCVSLKDVLQKYSKVDFLKIDIEGAEWNVIQNISNELNKVEHLFLEYHGKTIETQKLSDLLNILKNSGFSVYIRNAADNLKYPFLQKSTNDAYEVQLNIFCYRNQ
jgi:FkbM family methyltransferase